VVPAPGEERQPGGGRATGESREGAQARRPGSGLLVAQFLIAVVSLPLYSYATR
jgi:hypothetical protein